MLAWDRSSTPAMAARCSSVNAPQVSMPVIWGEWPCTPARFGRRFPPRPWVLPCVCLTDHERFHGVHPTAPQADSSTASARIGDAAACRGLWNVCGVTPVPLAAPVYSNHHIRNDRRHRMPHVPRSCLPRMPEDYMRIGNLAKVQILRQKILVCIHNHNHRPFEFLIYQADAFRCVTPSPEFHALLQ